MERLMDPASTTTDLLDVSSVRDYLVGRGLATAERIGRARRLSGGVSNVVLRVGTGDDDVIVKQALARLAVADDWYADRGRTQNEAAALRLLGRLSPDRVPALLDDDPARCALTMRAAPQSWTTWKSRLMRGDAEPAVAADLGRLLAQWHAKTSGTPLPERFSDPGVFRQLRIQPYFEVSARRHPAVADRVLSMAAELVARSQCLVLGDFSPKNILVGGRPDHIWVIDLEVAHKGDPAFDVAFMATHLSLKALHVATARDGLRECLRAFARGYGDGPGARDEAHLRTLLGCLLLARVLGSSPVEYLRGEEKRRVVDVADALLTGAAAAGTWWEAVEW